MLGRAVNKAVISAYDQQSVATVQLFDQLDNSLFQLVKVILDLGTSNPETMRQGIERRPVGINKLPLTPRLYNLLQRIQARLQIVIAMPPCRTPGSTRVL